MNFTFNIRDTFVLDTRNVLENCWIVTE